MRALQVLGYSLRDAWEEMFLVFGLSLLWWLATLTIFGAAPATTALAAVGYRLAQEQRVDMSFARQAFREHFWLSWRVGLFGLVTALLIIFNVIFYSQFQNWLRFAIFFFLYIAIAWMALHLYAFPLVAATDERRVFKIIGNAALITFANPIFSLIIVLGLLALTAVSLILPVLVVLVMPGLAGIVGARALVDRLELAEERQTTQKEKDKTSR